jgi:hypothetical protein
MEEEEKNEIEDDAQHAVTVPPSEPDGFEYTPTEKWAYSQIIYKMDNDQPWIDFADSSFRGSKLLIKGVADGSLLEDVEGIAGIQLFRHYLELVLKKIIFWGRMLESEDQNAIFEEVKEVAHIHDLERLWTWVLQDAKPKMKADSWESYDVPFVEEVIKEFDAADKKGFAFRYKGHGGEFYRYDYATLAVVMDHISQVLEALLSYLRETHGQNEEWESMLESEYRYEIGG